MTMNSSFGLPIIQRQKISAYTHIAVSSFVILLAVVLAAMLGIGYVNRNIRVNVEQA